MIPRRRILLVQERSELRALHRLMGDQSLQRIEVLTGVEVIAGAVLELGKRPYFHLEDLERI